MITSLNLLMLYTQYSDCHWPTLLPAPNDEQFAVDDHWPNHRYWMLPVSADQTKLSILCCQRPFRAGFDYLLSMATRPIYAKSMTNLCFGSPWPISLSKKPLRMPLIHLLFGCPWPICCRRSFLKDAARPFAFRMPLTNLLSKKLS